MTHITFDSGEFARTASPSPELLYRSINGEYRFPTPIELAIDELFTSEAVAHLVASESSETGLVIDRLTDDKNRVLVERTRTALDEPDASVYLRSVISWFTLSMSTERADVIVSNAFGELKRHVEMPTETKEFPLQANVKATLKQQLGAIARINQ